MVECPTFSWKNTHLRARPGYCALISIYLQGSVIILMDKTNIFQKCLKLFPWITASTLGRMPCMAAQCPLQTSGTSDHGTYRNGVLGLASPSAMVSHIFPLREMTWCPKTLQAYWRLVSTRLQPKDFCHSTFRTNRPHLQTCTCCKSVCKHCSRHHSTPCQRAKLLFKAQCWKTCWLPESLTLEAKFSDTSSTGTSHMGVWNPNLLP